MNDDLLPIDTERLVLRRFAPSDLSAFQSYRSDPELGRYQGWEAMSDADAFSFIEENARVTFGEDDRWFQIAIARRDSGELVGDIGLRPFDTGRAAEVGFTLSASAHGVGFATEAVAALVRSLFERTGIERVVAVTDERNTASIRLLDRLGMTLERADATTFRGEPCVEHTYCLSKS
jgi:[ribosomal protein S5]-alanine N-acetyltransferase